MGDSHIRSSLIEESAGLKVKFTNASFTNLTADVMHVAATHIATLKSNAVTATSLTVPTLLTVAATPGFKCNLVASAALSAGATTRLLRVTSAAATPMYVKVYVKS